MTETNTHQDQGSKSQFRIILLTGLLVGTLDILAATIQTLINSRSPLVMLKFIASGVFGKAAFSGGPFFAFYGLLFHYCIALGWTVLFFLVYKRFTILSKNKVITGVGYGIFVWFIMNQVVLPLSNTPPQPFRLLSATIASLILIVAMGLPLSFIASKKITRP